MKCPIDDTVLRVLVREGIEIDYCPKCRGVWLDRGELEKIIERTGMFVLRDEVGTGRGRQMAGRHAGFGPDDHDDPDDHHRDIAGYLFNF